MRRIEKRGVVNVLCDDDGNGCMPATRAEIEFFDEIERLRAENAALIAERAAPVQPVQAPMTERERRAPARREEMAAFAAELKADPVKAQRFFHEAGILDAQGNLTPQYGGREQALPDGWVPLVVTLPDSHPEEVAYGPKVMMDRLGKWLAKHFAAVQAQGEPVAWRIFDGEGNYDYRDDPPDEFNVSWSARYGRKYQPLYLHPPAAEVQRLKQERDGLKNRLEWRHDGGPDGISARDETIKMQDAEVRRLQEALEPFAAIDLTTNQAVDAMDVLRARRALEGK